jgi:hypothetical protein
MGGGDRKSYGDRDVDFLGALRGSFLRVLGVLYGLCDVELRAPGRLRAHIEV